MERKDLPREGWNREKKRASVALKESPEG